MHLGEKLKTLRERIGEHVEVRERIRFLGVIPFTKRHGWLSIEDRGDRWRVLWTRRGRDAYSPPRDGEATLIYVEKDVGGVDSRIDSMSDVWRGIPPLQLIQTEDRAKRIFRQMQRLVDIAYISHLTQPWTEKSDLIPSVKG